MPKQTFKIQGFHGGISSDTDPRDIQDIESPSLVDVSIDSVGRIKTLGSVSTDSTDSNALVIKPNKGLFVMNTDKQLDGTEANESFIIAYDAVGDSFDIKQGDDWSTAQISLDTTSPVFYVGDGNLRIGDGGFTDASDSKWFGYIEDERFNALSSDSGTLGWVSENQSIESPTSGMCLISTPETKSDTNGVNSSSAEYIGSVAPDSDFVLERAVADVGSVNLRVGLQYNQSISSVASGYAGTNCTLADETTYYPLIGDNNVKATTDSTLSTTSSVLEDSLSYSIDEENSVVFGFFLTASQYAIWNNVTISHYTSGDASNINFIFPKEDLSPDCWNLLVCSASNVNTSTYTLGDTLVKWIFFAIDTLSGSSSPTFWMSGPVVIKNPSLSGFQQGNYTFYHTYLYDDEKQESLPFLFEDPDGVDVNQLNIVGESLLLNFDAYINPFSDRQILTDDGIDIDQDTIDKASHGLINGDRVIFEGIRNATAIANDTLYYVVGVTTDTFQLSATKGGSAIDITGADDPFTTGTTGSSGAAADTANLTLATGASDSDDFYNGHIIQILAGAGAGQYRTISDYTGSSRVAVVSQAWTTVPSSSSFRISPAYRYYIFNKRITGSRLYYKLQEDDNLYLIGELDFVDKGFKWLPEGDVLAYSMANTASTSGNFFAQSVIVKGISPNSANTIDTFKNINGYGGVTKYVDAKFKTAVVHGRRAYIGNVRQPSGSTGKNHPDRMLKSQINKFDVFPDKMGSVDVTINDGESIVKLEAFADRILQFKEKTMYVINVSESVDFLEDTHENKGCAFPYHVTKTDFGIAWFNSFGVYFYDGKQVTNLLEKNGMRLISESDWEAFITDAEDGSADDSTTENAHIGYVPKKRQLLIKNENTDVFIYDFVLRAWMKGSSKITIGRTSNNTDETNMTNFVLDKNQDLMYLSEDDSDVMTWNPDAAASSAFVYQTKDIDFGEPGVRKKVYKVRISYKGDADSLNVRYSKNGDTDTLYNFCGTNADGSTTGSADATPLLDKTDLTLWSHAELKPSTSSVANNIYSFQIHMDGTVDSDFEINDISIIYRMKSIR